MKINFKLYSFALFVLLAPSLSFSATGDEDCVALGVPGKLDDLLNTQTSKNFNACVQRNNARSRASVEKMTNDNQQLVDNARTSCMNSIRRLSSAPSTLSFDAAPRYEILNGTIASGLDFTDGGYSVQMSGYDASGRFRVNCFMDKRFNVTHVR